MITFEGRQNKLKTADIIGRKAHSIYPHISGSKLKKRCQDMYNISEFSSKPMPNFYLNISSKISEIRKILRQSQSFFADLIYSLQDKKVGNCFEEACLAELIGKLNGHKNIYVGNIFIKKDNFAKKIKIDHSVAFITDKKIEANKEYHFKNKEAIIIDPWLGITDFADKYFTQLKNYNRKYFPKLPNQDFLEHLVGTESKNSKDYREGIKNYCQKINFNIELAYDANLSDSKENLYKSFFPELIIKKN